LWTTLKTVIYINMPVPQRALIVFDYIQNCLGGLSTGSSRACNAILEQIRESGDFQRM